MVKILIVGPHPDDVELCIGGILWKLRGKGFEVGVVDLTGGEAGTFGDSTLRQGEAQKAAEMLDLKYRKILNFPDAYLGFAKEKVEELTQVIREMKPDIMVVPRAHGDSHPDHDAAWHLVKEAIFLARLKRIIPSIPPFEVKITLSYPLERICEPTFVVDITDVFQRKCELIQSYRSQFFNDRARDYLEKIKTRALYYGSLVGTKYGEPLCTTHPIKIKDLGIFKSFIDDLVSSG